MPARSKHRIGRVSYSQRWRRWSVRYTWAEDRHQFPVANTEAETRRIAALINAELEAGEHSPAAWKDEKRRARNAKSRATKFSDVSASFLKSKAGTKSAGFYRAMVSTLDAEFGDKNVRAISADDIEQWLAKRRSEVGQASVKNGFTVLRMILRRAQRDGHISHDATQGIRVHKAQPTREFYATPEEADALVDAAPDWLAPFLVAAFETGGRRGELCGLMWNDLDLEAGSLRFTGTKSGKDRHVRLSAKLRDTLKALPSRFEGGRVFLRDGEPLKARRVTEAVNELVRSEAVDLRRIVRDADGTERKVWFRLHDCRHTFASWLLQSGVPLAVVQKLLGHQSAEMTARYAHLSPQNTRDAIGALDDLRAPTAPGKRHAAQADST